MYIIKYSLKNDAEYAFCSVSKAGLLCMYSLGTNNIIEGKEVFICSGLEEADSFIKTLKKTLPEYTITKVYAQQTLTQ